MITDLIAKYRDKPYEWPTASCVSVIKELSHIAPDYAEWEAMTEKACTARIMRMPGGFADNYVECHVRALGAGWVEVPSYSPDCDDIIFATTAWGNYVTKAMEVIEWRMPDGVPATMFCDGHSGFWTWVPAHGLKRVHGHGDVIKIMRRSDK